MLRNWQRKSINQSINPTKKNPPTGVLGSPLRRPGPTYPGRATASVARASVAMETRICLVMVSLVRWLKNISCEENNVGSDYERVS